MKKIVLFFCLVLSILSVFGKSQTIIVEKQEVYDFLDNNEFLRYTAYETSETEKSVQSLVEKYSEDKILVSDNKTYLVTLNKKNLVIYYQMDKTQILSFNLKKDIIATTRISLKENKKLRFVIYKRMLYFDDSTEDFSHKRILKN